MWSWWVCVLGSVLAVKCATQYPHEAGGDAYATLIYTDDHAPGVLALGRSIRDSGSEKELVVLVTEKVSNRTAETLRYAYLLLVWLCDMI